MFILITSETRDVHIVCERCQFSWYPPRGGRSSGQPWTLLGDGEGLQNRKLRYRTFNFVNIFLHNQPVNNCFWVKVGLCSGIVKKWLRAGGGGVLSSQSSNFLMSRVGREAQVVGWGIYRNRSGIGNALA